MDILYQTGVKLHPGEIFSLITGKVASLYPVTSSEGFLKVNSFKTFWESWFIVYLEIQILTVSLKPLLPLSPMHSWMFFKFWGKLWDVINNIHLSLCNHIAMTLPNCRKHFASSCMESYCAKQSGVLPGFSALAQLT